MKSAIVVFLLACCAGLVGLAMFIGGAAPAWAGTPIPAPLVGVTGPAGLLVAGVAYGGYLIFKRFRSRN